MTNNTVLTLVAPNEDALSAGIESVGKLLGAAGSGLPTALLGPCAVDYVLTEASLTPDAVQKSLTGQPIDFCLQPVKDRRKSLLICDMDSTIIEQECIDVLADEAGCGSAIAAITEAAMRGELDFAEALIERVAALKGLSSDVIDRVLAERITLSPGADTLVRTMAAHGARSLLCSGGFTRFTGPVADRAGFHDHRGNTLGLSSDGSLDGTVVPPILGKDAKREALIALAEETGLDSKDSIAIGDGANDAEMVQAAGLGIAYRAKPALQSVSDATITHCDLTAALYFQGYTRAEFVEPAEAGIARKESAP